MLYGILDNIFEAGYSEEDLMLEFRGITRFKFDNIPGWFNELYKKYVEYKSNQDIYETSQAEDKTR